MPPQQQISLEQLAAAQQAYQAQQAQGQAAQGQAGSEKKNKSLVDRVRGFPKKTGEFIGNFPQNKDKALQYLDGVCGSSLRSGASYFAAASTMLPMLFVNPFYAVTAGLMTAGITYLTTNTAYKLTKKVSGLVMLPIISPIKTYNMITGKIMSPLKTFGRLLMSPLTLTKTLITFPFIAKEPIIQGNQVVGYSGVNPKVARIAKYLGIGAAALALGPSLLSGATDKIHSVGSKSIGTELSDYVSNLKNNAYNISQQIGIGNGLYTHNPAKYLVKP